MDPGPHVYPAGHSPVQTAEGRELVAPYEPGVRTQEQREQLLHTKEAHSGHSPSKDAERRGKRSGIDIDSLSTE